MSEMLAVVRMLRNSNIRYKTIKDILTNKYENLHCIHPRDFKLY